MEVGDLTLKSFGLSASQTTMFCRDKNTGFCPSMPDEAEGYAQGITRLSASEILELLHIFCFSPSIMAFAWCSSFPSTYLFLITCDNVR